MFAKKVQPSRQVRRATERLDKKLKASIEKYVDRPMNPIRKQLLERINIALVAHNQREELGDQRHLHHALDFNSEYIERSRGHSKAKTFQKSVALAKDNTMLNPRKQH